MISSKILTRDDVISCVNMYYLQNDHSFLPVDINKAIYNLDLAIRRNKFVRLIKENNQILGWIYADLNISLHMSERILQQYYFCSNQTGVKVFRIIKVLHEDLLEYAKENKYTVVISTGSHLDPEYTFTRILEKLGWERRGYIAYKRPV